MCSAEWPPFWGLCSRNFSIPFFGKIDIFPCCLSGGLFEAMEDVNTITSVCHIEHPEFSVFRCRRNFNSARTYGLHRLETIGHISLLYPIYLEARPLPGIHWEISQPFSAVPQKCYIFARATSLITIIHFVTYAITAPSVVRQPELYWIQYKKQYQIRYNLGFLGTP